MKKKDDGCILHIQTNLQLETRKMTSSSSNQVKLWFFFEIDQRALFLQPTIRPISMKMQFNFTFHFVIGKSSKWVFLYFLLFTLGRNGNPFRILIIFGRLKDFGKLGMHRQNDRSEVRQNGRHSLPVSTDMDV